MYDNIKLTLPNAFTDNSKRDEFCTRFELFVRDEQKGIYRNDTYQGLKQCKGVYISFNTKKNKLFFNFSLHKFYNYSIYGKPFNYNDFDFKEAKIAAAKIDAMFTQYFDIMQASVNCYEVGTNVITSEEPIFYLQELKQINVQARIIRIIEDRHYKEYQQYGTHRDKDKRVVYIFYNKTFEARSKADKADRKEIPDNILRLEKDNRRTEEKISFARLFENDFIEQTTKEFKKRFTEDLDYKGQPVQPDNMKKAEYRLFCLLNEKGADGAKNSLKTDFTERRISRALYYDNIKTIDKLNKHYPKIETTITKRAAELNNLIISKINTVQKYGQF